MLERESLLMGKLIRIVEGSSSKSTTKTKGNSSRKQAAAEEQVLRSTGPVDRTCTTCTSESRSTGGRVGRPTVGFGLKSAVRKPVVFKGC